ncbi:endocuticle structural glycoprotein ABD-5-like [Trichoplusia ni]|uniref:Endocuticle structural glycoprotein ABD-5-like n=1 Tax=Trichoplusia ni TaxID=7111 RepID=A0A7E5VMP4_TRINI|nr:endocuticle structural glycoprotein ABD-5-like [Trichoplusia ni]
MKSRHHILEELDIKCGQLSPSHSQLRYALMKNAPNMVKGAHLHVLPIASMVFVTVLAGCLGAQIKKFVYNNNGFGSYSFEYKTSDGSYRREDGGLVPSPDGSSLVVRGEYGYIDTDGNAFSMKYVADRNGFQPKVNDDHTRFNDRRII